MDWGIECAYAHVCMRVCLKLDVPALLQYQKDLNKQGGNVVNIVFAKHVSTAHAYSSRYAMPTIHLSRSCLYIYQIKIK